MTYVRITTTIEYSAFRHCANRKLLVYQFYQNCIIPFYQDGTISRCAVVRCLSFFGVDCAIVDPCAVR